MPTVLRTGRYRIFFFSNEGRESPHVHVESGDSYAKYWLDPVEIDHSVGFHASELSDLARLVQNHREYFLERWHAHFGTA